MGGIVCLQEVLFFKIATGCQVAPERGLYKPAFLAEKSEVGLLHVPVTDQCQHQSRGHVSPGRQKVLMGGDGRSWGCVSLLGWPLQRTMNRNVFSLGPGGQSPETAVSRATPPLEAQERVLPTSSSFWGPGNPWCVLPVAVSLPSPCPSVFT